MPTLIRNASVIAPEPLGLRDILAAGERIVAVADPGTISISGVEVEEIDASGLFATDQKVRVSSPFRRASKSGTYDETSLAAGFFRHTPRTR
jgi:beta-aspartyl-dipeptidase (metallo-type)